MIFSILLPTIALILCAFALVFNIMAKKVFMSVMVVFCIVLNLISIIAGVMNL